MTSIALDLFRERRIPEPDGPVGGAGETVFCTAVVADDIDGSGVSFKPA